LPRLKAINMQACKRSYPIFDQHANAIAALTVPMLARIDDEAQMGIDAVREKLAEASLLISNRISLNL
jgi:DNA-binding IclR family transcriptional regulator